MNTSVTRTSTGGFCAFVILPISIIIYFVIALFQWQTEIFTTTTLISILSSQGCVDLSFQCLDVSGCQAAAVGSRTTALWNKQSAASVVSLNNKEKLTRALCVSSGSTNQEGIDFAPIIPGLNGGMVAAGAATDLSAQVGRSMFSVGFVDDKTGAPIFASYETPGHLFKLNSEGTKVDKSVELTNSGGVAAGFAALGKVYLLTRDIPASIMRIDLNTFDITSHLFGSSETCLAASTDGQGYGYFATYQFASVVYKVQLSSMTQVGTPVPLASTDGGYPVVSFVKGNFLYLVASQDPQLSETSTLVKIQIDTLTRVGAVTLNAGAGSMVGAGFSNQNGTIGYFATGSVSNARISPAVIFQVNLVDLSVINTIHMEKDETNVMSGFIDAAGKNMYFGTISGAESNPTSKIVKYAYGAGGSVQRIQALPLNASDVGGLGRAAFSTLTGSEGFFSLKGEIIKISLGNPVVLPSSATTSSAPYHFGRILEPPPFSSSSPSLPPLEFPPDLNSTDKINLFSTNTTSVQGSRRTTFVFELLPKGVGTNSNAPPCVLNQEKSSGVTGYYCSRVHLSPKQLTVVQRLGSFLTFLGSLSGMVTTIYVAIRHTSKVVRVFEVQIRGAQETFEERRDLLRTVISGGKDEEERIGYGYGSAN